jgi:nitrogen regulatory protein PII
MKLIRSLVRPEKLEAVKSALNTMGLSGIAVFEGKDHSPQKFETTVWRGHEYTFGFAAKVEVAVFVHDDDVDDAVKRIVCAARTGQLGDGHVAVLPVEHRYNICNGERDVS